MKWSNILWKRFIDFCIFYTYNTQTKKLPIMDINNQKVKQPIIRCFVHLSGVVGHIKYVTVQHNHENDVLECSDECIQIEILFEEQFMEEIFTPIYCYLREHFSNSDAILMVRSLIETGVQELKDRYSSYLYCKEIEQQEYVCTSVAVVNTKIMSYLTEVYEHLKIHFSSNMADEFCSQLILYGMTIVQQLPDTQVFGQYGYNRKNN